MTPEEVNFKWTRSSLMDLIEFARHSSPSYGITNVYDQFIEIVANPEKSLQQWYSEQAKNSLSNHIFNKMDMEDAFNLSRDRLFNPGGSFREYRFVNFTEYMLYREQSIKMIQENNQNAPNS